MKRLIAAFGLGVCATVGLAVYQGGEWLTLQGMRLSAATMEYDFVATPRMPEVQAEPVALARKGKR
jgi:hypothetical protein